MVLKADQNPPFQERKRMTRLGEALANRIIKLNTPLLSDYQIFLEVWKIYRESSVKYLRGDSPTRELFQRTRHLLKQENILTSDSDYTRMWRILSISDAPADEIACIADPFCYLSHISAMQRYGITDRRPEALFLTQPSPQQTKDMIVNLVRDDYGAATGDSELYIPQINATHHPARVRRRPVEALSTARYGEWRKVRGTFARLATIGQTFLDMLDAPDRCGGMLHVLETWEQHATTYQEDIISRLDNAAQPIHKVRAGYILEERMGLSDPRFRGWKKLAQRGGSRVLDPSAPFARRHSEDWMISINVG